MPDGFRSFFAYWMGGAGTSYPASTSGALIIAGVDRTEWLKANTGSFKRQFNQRSTFNGTLEDLGRGYRPVVGSSLIVMYGSTRLFGGFIVSVRERRHPTSGPDPDNINYEIEAVDNNLIADKRLIYYDSLLGVVSYGPGYAGDIMKLIAANALDGESVDVSLVETGPLISTPITFFFESVTAAFNKISQLSGYRWRIDEHKRLRFSEFTVVNAPFSITSTLGGWRDLVVERDTRNYRNKQFVRTETNIAGIKTETFTGDGSTRDFFIGFVDPVSANPTRFFSELPSITLGGVALIVGELGPDDPASFDVMYDAPAAPGTMGGVGVHFVSPQAAPGVGVIISVTYEYVLGNVVSDFDAAEILARATVEGGSGIWENMDEQRNVSNLLTLEQIAAGDLAFYAFIPSRVSYETDNQGLDVGQVQTITLPFHDLSANLLIESIDTTWMKESGFQFRHVVSCSNLGPMIGPGRVLEKLAEVARIGVPKASGALTSIAGIIDGGAAGPIGGRVSDGSAGNYLSSTGGGATNDSLKSSNGPFTVGMWIRVDNLGQASKYPFLFDSLFGSTRWGVDYGAVGGAARFYALGYSGSNPMTGADIAIADTAWHYVAWRKGAAGASTWEKILDGTAATINASINFTLGANIFYPRAFRADAGNEFTGALAHIAIWNVKLTDAEITQLSDGQRADVVQPTGLIQYWPISGVDSPEINNATSGSSAKPTLTINGSLPAA